VASNQKRAVLTIPERWSLKGLTTTHRTGDRPQPYAHGRLALRFPTAALAPDGSTQLYRYRLMKEGAPAGAEPLAAANCRIPNTTEAVEFMDRRLGRTRTQSVKTPSPATPMGA